MGKRMIFTPEQDQYLQLAQTRAYYQGMRDGVTDYAYWRDGVQYVGTSGRTLKEALADIDLLEKNLLARYQPVLEIKC
jgi:hypothetical protein